MTQLQKMRKEDIEAIINLVAIDDEHAKYCRKKLAKKSDKEILKQRKKLEHNHSEEVGRSIDAKINKMMSDKGYYSNTMLD